jgi:hypothetical protein
MEQNSFCTLPKPCIEYQSLWDLSFSFKYPPSTGGTYQNDIQFFVPLATFASDSADKQQCNIYVQYQYANSSTTTDIDKSITAGVMFFQAVKFLTFAGADFGGNDAFVSANPNAIKGTVWRIPSSLRSGPNPFEITPVNLEVVSEVENGLPTFAFNLSNMNN